MVSLVVKVVDGWLGFEPSDAPDIICALLMYCWPGNGVPLAVGEGLALAVAVAVASEVVGEAEGAAVLVAVAWGVLLFAVGALPLLLLKAASTPTKPTITMLRIKQTRAIRMAVLGFFFVGGVGRWGVSGVCCRSAPMSLLKPAMPFPLKPDIPVPFCQP